MFTLPLILAAAVGVLAGCSLEAPGEQSGAQGGTSGTATVVIGFKDEGRSAGLYTRDNISYLVLLATRDGSSYTEKYTIEYLPSAGLYRSRPLLFSSGLWHFSMNAYNSAKTAIFTGNQDATLADGSQTLVEFRLLQAEYAETDGYALDMTFGRTVAPGEFVTLNGVAFGQDGAIFASDADNHWIQVYNADGTYRESIGKSDGWTFNTAHQIAAAPDGSVWIADRPSGAIKKAVRNSSGSWDVRQIFSVDGLPSSFSCPEGIAVAPDGTVYVADTGNGRICVLAADGSYVSVWSLPPGGTSAAATPTYLALWTDPADSARYVFVYDSTARKVRKFTAAGAWKADSPDSGPGAFAYQCYGLVCDPAGNVFASDTMEQAEAPTGRIVVFSGGLEYKTAFTDNGASPEQVDEPRGLALSPSGGKLAVADARNHRCQIFSVAYDAGGLPVLTPDRRFGKIAEGPDVFVSPRDADFDSQGNLYILDRILHRVKKYNSDFAMLAEWGERTPARIGYGTNLRIHSAANNAGNPEDTVFVLDGDLRAFSANGSLISEIYAGGYTKPAGFTPWIPECFAIDSEGRFLLSHWDSAGIYGLDAGIGSAGWNAASPVTPALLWQRSYVESGVTHEIQEIAALSGGGYALLDRTEFRVRVFAPDGTAGAQFGSEGSGPGQFLDPRSMDCDSAGNIYVADIRANRIVKYASDGTLLGEIGAGYVPDGSVEIAVKGDGSEIIIISENRVPFVTRLVRN